MYLQDEPSIQENGLCEVKIVDNQIMNRNDRADYLNGILTALDGLYYYINDFESTGVLYYDIADLYNIQVGEKTYQCLMLNDEQEVTSGLKESVYTELPEQSETDYTKADKTDRKINQTYLIVDKQNQVIESVISNVTEQNNKIARVTQTVDELNSKISDIADITVSQETNDNNLHFDAINQSEPIRIVIHPIIENISYYYPNTGLFPDLNLFLKDRKLRFVRTYMEYGETLTENIDYTLPMDLLYYDSNNYDEFILDYEGQSCQVNKKVGYNADGTTYVLAEPYTIDFDFPQILLGDGDYDISLLGYNMAYMFVRLMAQNIYTTQFATRAEVSSEISQTTQEIDLSVNAKLSNYSTTTEMNSAISITANQINSTVSQKVGKNEVISSINQTPESITINANKLNLAGKTINMTSDNIKIQSTNFSVDKYGNMTCNDAIMNDVIVTGGTISLGDASDYDPKLIVRGTNGFGYSMKNKVNADGVRVTDNSDNELIDLRVGRLNGYNSGSLFINSLDGRSVEIYPSSITCDGDIRANNNMYAKRFVNSSKVEQKKNFEKLENALKIIKNTDIYKYNYKNEKDTDKKHIGLVIGGNYKYDSNITTKENDGADIYSFVSVCCKAIQEQQEQIEQLQKEIEKLKGGNKNV